VEWNVEKSIPDEILVWCLAAGFNPPGDSNRTGNLHGGRRLAMRCIPPSGSESSNGVQSVVAWRWGLTRQAVAAMSVCFDSLGA